MSKILNVRNSIKKIRENLQSHDFTCIFFNNNSSLYTTFQNNDDFMNHNDIFDKINNIRCSSITDFSKIEGSLEKLENIKDFCWENTTSILISDGYHTMDNFRTVDYVKTKFENKFDYTIGIGNEFDSILLNHISKTFLTQNDNNLFKFLFPYEDFVHILIPKESFFVCNKNFETISVDETMNLSETDVFSTSSNDFVEKKKFYNFKQNTSHESRHHYLFIIDISGSMDDSIYSCLLHDEEELYFFYDKFDKDTMIQVKDPEVEIYFEKKSLPCTIYQDYKIDTYHEYNEILVTCKSIFQMDTDPTINKLEFLFKLNHNLYRQNNLKKFVEAKYNSILSPSEKRMNLLLNENLTVTYMDSNVKTITEISVENRCSICLSKPKNILFSCHHVACCFDCVLQLLEPYDIPSCPICRSNIEWIRYIKNYDSNNIACKKCKKNLGDVFQNPCSHIVYCSECCDSNEYCAICDKKIERITKVHFS